MRTFLLLIAFIASATPSMAKTVDLLTEFARPTIAAPVPMTPIPSKSIRIAQGCCKTCSKGKACGDSCISRDKQCRKGQGCACD